MLKYAFRRAFLASGHHAQRRLASYTRNVPAHGGGAVSPLLVSPAELQSVKDEALRLPDLTLTKRQLCDIELLLNGGFTPLDGFMDKATYESVVHDMRLPNKLLWPMPITLDVSDQKAAQIEKSGESKLALRDEEGNLIAVLDIKEIYTPDKSTEGKLVFGGDEEHPAIRYLNNTAGAKYIGGKLRGVQLPVHYDHRDIRHTPAQVREMMQHREWDKVVAFQTRNPLHRAHYELTLRAMKETGANLLLHPVVGMTKPGDIDHHTRVKCYRQIMAGYPADSAMLAALPLAMRMGGPREAVWHALIRKNFGATHFIIGRDHAGPGSNSKGKDFYGPYEARDFALKFQNELGIQLCPFEMMVYVPQEKKYYPINAVPQGMKKENLSGTEVRRRLQTGEEIPEWFSFPAVANILRQAHPPRSKQGFCVFFTGLSGSGKTTIANALMERLMELDNRAVCILDGDHVRQMLSSELGFSREHRNLNIMRIGWVASEVVKPGGAVIACPIAPYKQSRQFARDTISKNGGYIEVFVNTTLETCEKRDRKGLYKKARQGIVKNFTGIDDPYEAPEKPEITIVSGTEVLKAVDQIVAYLEKEGYVSTRSSLPEAAAAVAHDKAVA